MKYKKICIYCEREEKDLMKERRFTNHRVPCLERDTPQGFHKFKLIECNSANSDALELQDAPEGKK